MALACTRFVASTLPKMNVKKLSDTRCTRPCVKRRERRLCTRVEAMQNRSVETALRASPLVLGAAGATSVVLNRLVRGSYLAVYAGGADSRADVLALALSAVLVFTGLQLVSLQSRAPQQEEPRGVEAEYVSAALPRAARRELHWAMEAMRSASTVRTMMVYHRGIKELHRGATGVVFHAGVLPCDESKGKPRDVTRVDDDDDDDGNDDDGVLNGELARGCLDTGRGRFIANLVLSPARLEFRAFMPENTQSMLVQPLGSGNGIMVLGADTVRGISKRDQVRRPTNKMHHRFGEAGAADDLCLTETDDHIIMYVCERMYRRGFCLLRRRSTRHSKRHSKILLRLINAPVM